MKDDENEKVGYGRPPKATRFKKGQSGNPKGRPRTAPNVGSAIRAELQGKITAKLSESGRKVTLTKAEALAKKLVSLALGGDMRAFENIMRLLPDVFAAVSAPADQEQLDAEDQAIIERFVLRSIRQAAANDPTAPGSEETPDGL